MELRIKSRQNPLIAKLRKLGGDRGFRRSEGLFLCEGLKLVEEAIRWHTPIETLVQAESAALPAELPDGVQHVLVPPEIFEAISTVDSPQGVLAVCRMPALAPSDRLTGRRYLVLDGVQDPGNVGTVWRTADAFGADGLFCVNHCADPFSPKTVRSTMGACFRLPVWETDLASLKRLLDDADIPLYATALREDTEDVRQAELCRAAMVIGSEGRGVSEQALALCAKTFKIPMTERCESLNAAVAAAILLWEMYRKR